jgi:hypothetical protein
MTGKGSGASLAPPAPQSAFAGSLCLTATWLRQDCNDGQRERRFAGSPCTPIRVCRFALPARPAYCNLGPPKIAMTGKGSGASLAPTVPQSAFADPLLPARSAYCNLGPPKIAMTGKRSGASLAPPVPQSAFAGSLCRFTLPVHFCRFALPTATWARQGLQ